MGGSRLAFPWNFVRRLQALQRRAERGGRRIDGESGMVDAAEFLGARMHMHQFQLRLGNVEQRVALGRHLAQAPADQQHQVGTLDARQQLRVRRRCRHRRRSRDAAHRTNDRRRKVVATGSAKRSAKRASAAQAASDQRLPPTSAIGRLRSPQQLLQPAHVGQARPGFRRLECGRIRHHRALGQHVLRQRDHHRARAAVAGGVEGARDHFRDARGVIDFGRPFGDRAEHRAVIEFLERLALAHLPPDLPDEHDHRRGILARDVDAGRGIGGARPARDEADAGAAGRLADRFRHHRRRRSRAGRR